ncbi:MAG: WecB/TagA/CpsF family glycosyltransferase [Chloroflexota bacterium]
MIRERVNVLGVGISPTHLAAAVQTITRWIERGEKHYVCVTGVHGVTESLADDELKRIHNRSGLTVPDGMPMVWLSRRAGFHQAGRVYGPDLMLALCEVAAKYGYTNFLYGGAAGVPELLAHNLTARFAGLPIVGGYSPPFRPLTPAEDEEVIGRINAARPDIVWVGLSTPKQERWMAAHREQLSAAVLIGVGAAFDVHANRRRQAPAWMQRNGLEWFYRLLQEPRRLWRRYLFGNTRFALHLFMQRSGLRQYPLLK